MSFFIVYVCLVAIIQHLRFFASNTEISLQQKRKVARVSYIYIYIYIDEWRAQDSRRVFVPRDDIFALLNMSTTSSLV